MLELGDLRKIGGVNQEEAGNSSGNSGEHDQQNEQRGADEPEADATRLRGGIRRK